jgi:hypothetical protein
VHLRTCRAVVDMRELAQVLEHEGPLPHLQPIRPNRFSSSDTTLRRRIGRWPRAGTTDPIGLTKAMFKWGLGGDQAGKDATKYPYAAIR